MPISSPRLSQTSALLTIPEQWTLPREAADDDDGEEDPDEEVDEEEDEGPLRDAQVLGPGVCQPVGSIRARAATVHAIGTADLQSSKND